MFVLTRLTLYIFVLTSGDKLPNVQNWHFLKLLLIQVVIKYVECFFFLLQM